MATITNIFTRKPYNPEARITSASKPNFIGAISAREKTDILLYLGWERDASGYRVLFRHNEFYEGAWVYLDTAWQGQYLSALGTHYWGEKA